jgi:hypothetical protein
MLLKKCGLPLGLSLVAVVSVYAAQPITEITLPGSRLFTESITSTKDGTLFAPLLNNSPRPLHELREQLIDVCFGQWSR